MKINSKNPLTLYIKGSLLEVIIGGGNNSALFVWVLKDRGRSWRVVV